MTIQVIDPRMPAPMEAPRLAARAGSLAGARVMLFDNGKLAPAYGPYRAIFQELTRILTERFENLEFIEHTDDLLRGESTRLDEVGRWVAGQGVAGVIFALCDWGVSQPTALVACRLEQLGVPTSLVTTGIGAQQALATASYLAPGLPVTQLRSPRSATRDAIIDETRAAAPDILEGLLAPAERLQARFARQTPAAPPAAERSGVIYLDGEDTSAAFTEAMRESHLGDGLPLVAPTAERVEAFLARAGAAADESIWPAIPPRSSPVAAREIAAVAVAAGCQPRWAPVVLAAYRAMAQPQFRLFQAAITTHPGGTLVFVSGPESGRLGYACGRGALGPGFAANATTGRAVALGYSFLLGAIPGGADLTAQGSPAEYSYCCAENIEASPWPGLHADAYHPDETTVTVLKCEGPHNMLDQQSTDPAMLLGTFASTMATLGSNAAYVSGGQTMLMLNPEHAALLSEAGWTKRDVREFLFDAARNHRDDLRGRGIAPIWPTWFDKAERVPVLSNPDDLLVTVTGGSGPASQVAIPWGYSRAVTVPVSEPTR